MASKQKYTETPISSHSLTGMELLEQLKKQIMRFSGQNNVKFVTIYETIVTEEKETSDNQNKLFLHNIDFDQ